MSEPLKAADVQKKHADVIAALEAFDAQYQELLLLTPEAEEVADPKRPKRRMFTPDMLDSARAIARNLKIVRFDVLTTAQGVINYTEEAREAALEAQKGRFKVLGDQPTEAPKEAPNGSP